MRAPQGGPVYVHEFEGSSPGDLLEAIAEGLDLTRADSVTVEMRRVEA